MVEITENELAVLGRMAARLAEREGEDILGAIMKLGGFRELGDVGVVKLARQLHIASQRRLPSHLAHLAGGLEPVRDPVKELTNVLREAGAVPYLHQAD